MCSDGKEEMVFERGEHQYLRFGRPDTLAQQAGALFSACSSCMGRGKVLLWGEEGPSPLRSRKRGEDPRPHHVGFR